MATYSTEKGFTIQTIAGDPSPLLEGQVWYNSTTYALKGALTGVGAWASGGNLNTARDLGAGFGIQTAALYTGGETPITGKTETYDGSAWTEVADLNTVRYGPQGFGSTSADVPRIATIFAPFEKVIFIQDTVVEVFE